MTPLPTVPILPLSPRQVERFWSKVDRSGGPDTCWPWIGGCNHSGYGLTGLGQGQSRFAHRIAWFLEHGPSELHVLHSCDNPPCCNPAHLWVGTHWDNVADAKAKGRIGRVSWKCRRAGGRFPAR